MTRNPRFQPNLGTSGRWLRALLALALLLGAWLAREVPVAAVALGLSAAFVMFEAWRGWCAVRACGIKTRW